MIARLLLAVGCGLILASNAHATDWYFFNFGTLHCMPAAQIPLPKMRTPFDFRALARQSSSYGGTRVWNFPGGRLVAIVRFDHRDLVYTSGLTLCQKFKGVFEHNGNHVSNLNELK